jgi:hypothetical protein
MEDEVAFEEILEAKRRIEQPRKQELLVEVKAR